MKSTLDRAMALATGICCVLIGVFAMFQRRFYSTQYDRYIDLGQYHQVFGIFALIIGVLFIYATLRKRG